jgi:arylsulfatase B
LTKRYQGDELKRRDFLKHAAKAFAGASVSPLFFCREKRSKHPPNILIFVSDDTGWNDVGYHNSEIKTPNIDRLVEHGVELDNFYVSPVCSPTRAALLTGRLPSRYGILEPIALRSKQTLPQDTVTLAEFLRRNGYQTAITGKWHLGLRPEVGPKKYGFDYSYGYLHGQLDQYTHFYKNGNRTWHRNDEFMNEEGHATDLIT